MYKESLFPHESCVSLAHIHAKIEPRLNKYITF